MDPMLPCYRGNIRSMLISTDFPIAKSLKFIKIKQSIKIEVNEKGVDKTLNKNQSLYGI